MKYAAKKLLKSAGFLFHKGNGGMMNDRVRKLTAFLEANCVGTDDALDRVKIETNNSNTSCKKSKTAFDFENIGSSNGKYQIWAVIRNGKLKTKVTRKEHSDLYKAIYHPIMDLRIQNAAGMSGREIEQKLSELEIDIYKRVSSALNLVK